jgi:HD-like signal output (HDOD) protein
MMTMTQQQFAGLEARAEQFVRTLALPPCPEILARIAQEVRADTPDVRKVGDLVTRDVATAAGVLKTVNSAGYALSRPARSVQQAIAYLGLERTALLLAGLLLRNAFPRSDRAAMARFWQSSTQAAAVAGFLARVLGLAERDEAYTFGLFRDAGSAVLICRYPDYAEIMAQWQAAAGTACTDHEKSRFGADHAVIGAVLARDWHLPEEMSDAILWHHADFVLALDAAPIRLEAVRLIALGVLCDHVLARYCAEPASGAGSLEHALRLLGIAVRDFADLQVEALTLLGERDGRPMPTMRLRSLRA